MSTDVATSANNTPQAHPKKNRLVPPEERFWKRYSPHHEFPLSAVSSVVVHVLGFFLIALVIGGFFFSLRPDNRPPEVEAIVIAGGGGRPDGTDAGKAGGTVPQEAVTQQPEQVKTPVVSPVELNNVSPEPKKLDLVKDNESDRTIEADTAGVASALANVQERARQQIAGLLAPKGRGGSGEGGGRGDGSGTGEGNMSGPGSGKMTQRQKRQLRWTMMFNTRDGGDYLRQLQALRAILAIPEEGGQFRVLKDLSQRPVRGEIEDISQINRIYWIDDKPQSVASLSMALGLPAPPRFIAAFFPEALEKELLDKERRHFRGSEDDILETKFMVTSRGGTYEAVVQGVIGKSRSRR